MFHLPALPYELHALEPHLSRETLDYHYNKHHKTYLDNLNKLIENTPDLQGKTLEEVVRLSSGVIFNNAAQVWNHSFYWNCLSPQGGSLPEGQLLQLIERDFGSFQAFKEKFTDLALKTFGSGWAWLVLTPLGTLELISTSNAQTPLTTEHKPLMTCDVWEHAYYIDYRNARAQYMAAFWNLVNWAFIANQLND